MIPGRAAHPRVRELKPWVRATITLWVALVLPSLAYWVAGFVIVAPRVLPVVWTRLFEVSQAVAVDAVAGRVTGATMDVVNLVLLVLPWVGSVLLLIMIVRWPVEAMSRRRATGSLASSPWAREMSRRPAAGQS